MQDKNIKLTITMLVSNRIGTIRKCMDSIKPILAQVPSELIVVDTGSTDGSIDVVREYTDKIVKFPWCNDFSKARNAGLKDASGEWIMSLDDDEWFDDVSEIVNFFNTGEYQKYNRAIYIVRNYVNPEGTDWSESNAGRMVKHFPDTCYSGRVHEFIGPIKGPTKFFDAFVHHYGYVFQSEEERFKHSRRNISLLETELEEFPEDMRVIPQMAQEYYSVKENQRLLELCKQGMGIYKRTRMCAPGAGYCYVFSLRAYMAMKDWCKAYEWGKKLLEGSVPTRVALLGIVREMVTVCQKSGHYKEGLDYLHKYCHLYTAVKKNIDRDEIYLTLSKYLMEQEPEYAYMEGIALGALAKDWKSAYKYFCLKNWNIQPLIVHPDTLDYVMELWTKYDFQQEFSSALDKIVSNPPFHPQITNNMNKYKIENLQSYRKLLYIFYSCSDTSAYTDRYRFYYCIEGVEDADRQKIAELIMRLWQDDANPLLWDDQMWFTIYKYNLSVTSAVKKTGLMQWFAQVRSWLEFNMKKNGKMDEVFNAVYNAGEPEEMCFRFLKLKYEEGAMRRMLRERGEERMDSQWLLNCLDMFYSNVWEFYALIYRNEMFGYDMATILPPEAAFAVYIRLAAQCRKSGDNEGYLHMIPKAAECYPPMKEWCKVLLQKEKEERLDGCTRGEQAEFQMLAGQMKQKLRELLDSGNHEAAKQVILQLEKLLPGDTELIALMEKIP